VRLLALTRVLRGKELRVRGEDTRMFGLENETNLLYQKGRSFGRPSQFIDVLEPHEHPVVLPHVSHFIHVPFRTSVKFPHSPHISPS
jgi:hypothetical protein